ncbi:MAG TPA: ATPase [Marinilabiliales bacterium]|nr:MAG: ATPase [Bacteroidetes bacterium GWA2_40_14]OFX59066.1 MAG: ATPase [Bacteroidetes bacterium GWC2_40_13]OFX72221.1 MAG: ATPase [Bacteroidetes bacterium GWD2_40_43]OFX90533.1 MAG: ATPase [Bacteroidetes bacterium GWE2_40_63]OFY17222.1 MAG: ATPase [Bacteroidetes bacterium GWF2_40_13]OFZ26506.1 MAG: ATPase [Bacteroidetes bacterium RIFOXYC2_FULL_40_12]HAN00778.1 ATPase [Marinilabiliales bacterium]
MILEIRLSNFFSIKDEVTIDFRAANIKSANAKALKNNIFQQDKSDILKTLIIYGANASGKSNIVKAIRFCNAMVFESHNHNENTIYNFIPFKFENYSNKPSSYLIRFVLNDIEYEYSFSMSRTSIIAESLYYYPKGRIKEIFTRDEKRGKTKKQKYTFTDVIKRPFDVAENTSDKTLYISRASQMDRDLAKEIFNYFNKTFVLNYLGFGISAIENITNLNKQQLIDALKIADSDIEEVKIKVLKKSGKNIHADLTSMTLKVEDVVQDHLQIKTYHKTNPDIAFDFFTEESQGTIKLFFIMLTLLDVIKRNKILLIDEIEESLHPKIIEYIFNLFRAGNKAQLLCTTHNTQFLDLKKFRKDQIYFVNKNISGATDLYSLYDYSDFRDTMDLEKAYMQGRFDAVPIVNDSYEQLKSLLNEK